MQTVSSYGVEIRKQNIPIRQTLEIYRQAVSYLTEICEQVWAELKMIPEAKKRFNAAEHLIHTTKKNHAAFVTFSEDAFLSQESCHPACTGKCIVL